jgi:hypothetical protein
VPHAAFLASVGVEAGHCQARIGNAEIAHQARAVIALRRVINSGVISPGTAWSGTCTVIGTTLSEGPASIITASSGATPLAWPTNSVCPGWLKPTLARRLLETGAVTRAEVSPPR